MQKAKVLLQSGEYDYLKAVAKAVGYSNPVIVPSQTKKMIHSCFILFILESNFRSNFLTKFINRNYHLPTMSNYYQIINGNRYNASLISNGLFRTRGNRDNTISKQDAQELWRIAMDGGRITEVEENTIEYLMNILNWTDAARKWMEAELSNEVEKLKSYYKIIDGLRYDRKILKEAEERTKGRGDGRISQEDAEFLLPLFGDFGDVTIVEERTLKYIIDNFKWTDAAQNWFLEKVNRISKQSDIAGALNAIMKFEYGFENLGLAYFKDEALQQMLDFDNKISLPDALRRALDSLLNDKTPKSFGDLLSGYTSESAQEFLEGGRLVLLPGDMASEPSLDSFPTPLNGESLAENWIFGLELFDLTDDVYWVIVSRDGSKPAYNYIGGPNVEDDWPRYSGKNYFMVEVLSCDIPYPGITVDVQDPFGKYTVGKSDAKGLVKIIGPAGEYSIYASDGWSFQSKTFNWDGEGTDQVKKVVLDC